MARKKKIINQNSPFLTRLIELSSRESRSLEDLAEEFGASRQTVSKWLGAKALPDIDHLEKIANYYKVSTDYLLGLSSAKSSDVNVKAAMEYTGLSEEAVEWLHIGLDDFKCDGVGLSEEMKKRNQNTASSMIKDKAFTEMIYRLNEISLEAYLEKVFWILDTEHSACGSAEDDTKFIYANHKDRDLVKAALIHVREMVIPWDKHGAKEEVESMDDDELYGTVMSAYLTTKEKNELHQFHAAKAFNSYIDRLVETSIRRAEQRFERTET